MRFIFPCFILEYRQTQQKICMYTEEERRDRKERERAKKTDSKMCAQSMMK